MGWEILVGVLLAGVILYLFYIYLAWCSLYSDDKALYDSGAADLMFDDERQRIENYGWLMLPEYLSDTYKPIRFYIMYNIAKL